LTGQTRSRLARSGRRAASGARQRFTRALGGVGPARVVVVVSAVGGLASADVATVGASASQLRESLQITNTDVGLLAAVSSPVGAMAPVPLGMLADRAGGCSPGGRSGTGHERLDGAGNCRRRMRRRMYAVARGGAAKTAGQPERSGRTRMKPARQG
jgi:hypothetical protein